VALVLLPVLAAGCQEETPVGLGGGPLPGEPVTVEVTIPWSGFASNLEVFGGYGSPADLGRGVVALQYEGVLEARTLMRVGPYPDTVSVRDSTGTIRPDAGLTFLGGRLVARFDTIASTTAVPIARRGFTMPAATGRNRLRGWRRSMSASITSLSR